MLISLKNVEKKYQDFHLNCSLEVGEGQITGFVGRNGSGKSTTIKAVLGLIKTDGGTAEVFGRPVAKLTPEDREKIGVVLADSGFSGYLRIKDLLPMLKAMYHSFDEEGFLDRCKEFSLPLNKKIKEFSTGMKRRLQINAAISHGAKLLILDEPTAGLDVIAREDMLDLLREYMEVEGRAILISSHISSDLEGFCDDLYMIDEGKIVFHEETDRLLDEYGILKLTEEEYEQLDKSYIVYSRKANYGYCCLTNEKQFYQENYPDIVIEKGSIDELITLRKRGA